jgi:signal transduction histidine kinase
MTSITVRALIVEDEASYQRIVEIRLRSWNPAISLQIATSLQAARAMLDSQTQPFDLVVLDQNLPDGFGWTLLTHPGLSTSAVLAVSADDSPELPAQTLRAGAQHFLAKRQISEPLFVPLLEALIERRRLEAELFDARVKASQIDTIKTLLSTLRHEINNPLGAVLGGTYLIRSQGDLAEAQVQALKLVEASGQRIKHVIEQLCDAAELKTVTKAHETVFHIPGDKPWRAGDPEIE